MYLMRCLGFVWACRAARETGLLVNAQTHQPVQNLFGMPYFTIPMIPAPLI
ncbi:MAG: hypothetical protein UX78_C0021G0010 [Candidatus Amesbacteria bacterium GW2011_GWA2_47_11]|uniref:Uncharacterized protein n=2 Tax=Candidatus Amesiibacteriota TaxID=1752730 RepID=A0A0G1WWC5_9BACT|nr:MAG: hypothetical protein UX78_C0021G0010 [Candidatus Amesbacteria bacterium GW2011_GWA2_47_11]KKU94643.1 MAG: hypothetical protein UY22_C0010G0019 [Candidatus Amesbacteria bacterium GW2011_GWC1_48_10]